MNQAFACCRRQVCDAGHLFTDWLAREFTPVAEDWERRDLFGCALCSRAHDNTQSIFSSSAGAKPEQAEHKVSSGLFVTTLQRRELVKVQSRPPGVLVLLSDIFRSNAGIRLQSSAKEGLIPVGGRRRKLERRSFGPSPPELCDTCFDQLQTRGPHAVKPLGCAFR